MNSVISLLIIGIGATVFIDLWSIIRKQVFGITMPNYGLVGRWIAYLPLGRFYHNPITTSPAIKYETLIGWIAHYLIGISFATVLIGLWGMEWLLQPTLGPAIVVGLGTVVAPFLLMQPGMGAGLVASRTPNPKSARVQSLITHLIFGLGLYFSGLVNTFISGFFY